MGQFFKMSRQAKLKREFYTRRNTLQIARELLGKRLVVPAPDGTRVSGLIVETEAYLGPEDRAAHSYNHRRTPRTEMMFGEGGRAYVYFIYGMYYQFNVVTNVAEIPHAVLVRALEPEDGLEWMRQRRPVKDDRHLTSGPGKLCMALGLDRTFNGEDLLGERVWIEDAGRTVRAGQIISGPRVGIDYAGEYVDKPWRFRMKDNLYVSR
jgi:DNA-3-methyladenine glycosylase